MADLKDITRRTWEEMLPSADMAALASVIDADCINHDTPPGVPQGLEGVRQTVRMLQAAFSDQRYEVHHIVHQDDMVAIHATLLARHSGPFMGLAPTGREVALRSIHLIRYRDGREVETWAIQDRMGLRQQLGAPAPGSRTEGQGVDDRERNKALIRTYWDAVNAEDYATLESIHDPAARNHAPAAFDLTEWPSEGKQFGPVEVRETYQWIRSGQPDLHVDVEALIAEDDQVVAWVRATSTLTGAAGPIPPTGRRIDFPHAHRFRIRDGRIVEHWAVRDDLRAMLQAGVVTPPGRPVG